MINDKILIRYVVRDSFLYKFGREECAYVETGHGIELSVVGDGGGDGAREMQ